MLFTHIHPLFYCVVFLNNQRRHPEVMSLLTTTILSLLLNSLNCYHSPPGVASVLSFVSAKMKGAGRTRRLGSVGGGTSFRRTSFVVQTKILYCETTIAHKMSFWRQKLSQFVRKLVSQNKAKNAGRSWKNAGMREIRQNAGFPARLRDG